MQELKGKVAVVTGGGSGIGRAMALAFAEVGMDVLIADIDADALETVRDELGAKGARARAYLTDVTDRAAVEELAAKSFAELGAVHLLCNNAGVATGGPLPEMTDEDWRWLLSVNLEGVVNGVQAFVPRMIAQGQGGHIVNTASVAGLFAAPYIGIYNTTKYAVVGLSESLRQELAPHGIGVSALCPGFVRTRIHESDRSRPEHLSRKNEAAVPDNIQEVAANLMAQGLDPLEVGKAVVAAVRADDAYIITHPEMKPMVEARFTQILEAFDKATKA